MFLVTDKFTSFIWRHPLLTRHLNELIDNVQIIRLYFQNTTEKNFIVSLVGVTRSDVPIKSVGKSTPSTSVKRYQGLLGVTQGFDFDSK